MARCDVPRQRRKAQIQTFILARSFAPPHADGDTCPYCGQDIRCVPLIAAYRAVFSDRYKSLGADIAAKV